MTACVRRVRKGVFHSNGPFRPSPCDVDALCVYARVCGHAMVQTAMVQTHGHTAECRTIRAKASTHLHSAVAVALLFGPLLEETPFHWSDKSSLKHTCLLWPPGLLVGKSTRKNAPCIVGARENFVSVCVSM